MWLESKTIGILSLATFHRCQWRKSSRSHYALSLLWNVGKCLLCVSIVCIIVHHVYSKFTSVLTIQLYSHSLFYSHTEDMNLLSINYLHAGAPKYWYAIAPEDAKRFESLAQSRFVHAYSGCKEFLQTQALPHFTTGTAKGWNSLYDSNSTTWSSHVDHARCLSFWYQSWIQCRGSHQLCVSRMDGIWKASSNMHVST